jgi:hypothetical protein
VSRKPAAPWLSECSIPLYQGTGGPEVQHITDLIALINTILNLAMAVIEVMNRVRKGSRAAQPEDEGECVDDSIMQSKLPKQPATQNVSK